MDSFIPILIVGAALCLIGVLAYLAYLAEKKRAEGWKRAAEDLGFEFRPSAGKEILSRFPGFHLFTQGRSRTVKNLLVGQTSDLEVAIFDYSYVTGSGKNRHTWHQTVVAFEFDEPVLPTFSLRPESVFHKIGQWFGYRDIDFESHPHFSKKYLLRGEDEEAVRACFAEHVLEHYEEMPNVCTEACGGRLVYYKASTRRPPEQARTLLEEGFSILALFRPPSKGEGS